MALDEPRPAPAFSCECHNLTACDGIIYIRPDESCPKSDECKECHRPTGKHDFCPDCGRCRKCGAYPTYPMPTHPVYPSYPVYPPSYPNMPWITYLNVGDTRVNP